MMIDLILSERVLILKPTLLAASSNNIASRKRLVTILNDEQRWMEKMDEWIGHRDL